jgi:NAD-dependent deacetylase
VLTGAGVSTESGIPDFRSPTGIWAQYDPMEYATIDAFWRDPVKVWGFYRRRFHMLRDAEPNPAHVALADLERGGWIDAVVTQNIDRLHERAGSKAVIEVHGSYRTSSCPACGTVVGFEDVLALLDSSEAPPCPRCSEILKPDVVLFGELMPVAAIERAFDLARSAGLLLVVGSSLEVYPVADLPRETVSHGGALALVNKARSSCDMLAELIVAKPAGEVLPEVLRELRAA